MPFAPRQRASLALSAFLLGLLAGCRPEASAPPAADPRAHQQAQAAIPPPATTATPTPSVERLDRGNLELRPGARLSGTMQRGEQHLYHLGCTAGLFYDLVVHQRGLDVEVKLFAPDGSLVRRVDSLYEGTGIEPLPLVAASSGPHTLELTYLAQAGQDPHYELEVKAVRAPSLRDRTRVQAEALFAEADLLAAEGGPRARQRKITLYRQVLPMLRAVGDDYRATDAQYLLGYTQSYGTGQEAEAIANIQAAEVGYERDHRQLELAKADLALGRCYRQLRRLPEAIQLFSSALARHRQVGILHGQASALTQLGQLYGDSGNFEFALRSFDEGLALARQEGDTRTTALALHRSAVLYRNLGAPKLALARLEEALVIRREQGFVEDEAIILRAIGLVWHDLGQVDRSLEYLAQAGALLAHLDDRVSLAVNFHETARVLDQGAHRKKDAVATYREAITRYDALGERVYAAISRLNLCTLLDTLEPDAGTPDPAIEPCFREVIATFRDYQADEDLVRGLDRYAAFLHRHRRHSEAESSLREALSIIEHLRTEVVSNERRAALFARRVETYAAYVDVLLALGARRHDPSAVERAFEVSERSKARSLLDTFRVTGGQLRRGVPRALLDEELRVAGTINDLAFRRLFAGPSDSRPDELDGLELRLRGAELYAERLEALIRQASPALKALGEVSPLPLATIRERTLDADTALLEFLLGSEASYLWLVGPGAIECFALPPRDQIEGQVTELEAALEADDLPGSASRLEAKLAALSSTLLGPLVDRQLPQNLIIVPDGALGRVPFSALALPATKKSGPPGVTSALILEHRILLVPSASALALLHENRRSSSPEPGGVLVVADPVVSADDPRLAGTTPSNHVEGTSGPRSGATGLERLRFAEREAEAVVAALRPEPATRLLGFDATREAILDDGRRPPRVAHFATHGLADPQDPDLSALVLSLFDRSGQATDGLLRAPEIARLHFPAQLVVLSACKTGLGRQLRGEGTLGLSRGFVAAGARVVLASLWEVDDRATAELMTRFYASLAAPGTSPMAALQRAQLAMATSGRWQDPRYWAGWIVQGAADEPLDRDH